MVWKDGKVLLHQRKSAHGEGEYSFPGGHLEMGESLEECAKREVREEAGIEIQNIRFFNVTNIPGLEKHYVTLGIEADWQSGEPSVMEPDKCVSWGWYDPKVLPEPLWKYTALMFDTLQNGTVFFDL